MIEQWEGGMMDAAAAAAHATEIIVKRKQEERHDDFTHEGERYSHNTSNSKHLVLSI